MHACRCAAGRCSRAGYRLRILRVNDLPIHTTFDGRTFEFQLGVSLYDEAYGTFYGNTCYRWGQARLREPAQALDLRHFCLERSTGATLMDRLCCIAWTMLLMAFASFHICLSLQPVRHVRPRPRAAEERHRPGLQL